MSTEAGSVFPLSRLAVIDFSPLSPTNKAANPTAADTACFFCAQMWMASLHQRAPDLNPASPSASLAKPYTRPQPPVSLHTETLIHSRSFSCLEHFGKTLMKSTCKWFVYLQNRNTLLSLVISLLLNREPVLAWEQTQSCYSCMGSVPRFLPPVLLSLPTTLPCAQDMIRHCFFKLRLSWYAWGWPQQMFIHFRWYCRARMLLTTPNIICAIHFQSNRSRTI